MSYGILNHTILLADHADVQRATEDALWLQSLVEENVKGSALDVGAGSGVVGLCLVKRCSHIQSISFIENNGSAIDALEKSLELNHVQNMRILVQDIFQSDDLSTYQIVLSNPPFYVKEKGHDSEKSSKKDAHYISEENIIKWVQFCIASTDIAGHLGLVLHLDAYNATKHLYKGFSGQVVYLGTSKEKEKRVLVWLSKSNGLFEEKYLDTQDKKIREAVLKNGASLWKFLK